MLLAVWRLVSFDWELLPDLAIPVLVPCLVELHLLHQDVLVMEVIWGSVGDASVIEVIIQPILKAHKDVFWPAHKGSQISELLCVFSHPAATFNVIPGLAVDQGVFKPPFQVSHKAIEVLQLQALALWRVTIHLAAAPSRARVTILTLAPWVKKSCPYSYIYMRMWAKSNPLLGLPIKLDAQGECFPFQLGDSPGSSPKEVCGIQVSAKGVFRGGSCSIHSSNIC